jgi:hypothetical protein
MMTSLLHPCPAVAAIAVALMTVAGATAASGQNSAKPSDLEQCRAITDSAARLRCFERALADHQKQSQSGSRETGAWRLVRTPDPRRGPDAVSIMHTADISRSDPDFAGLMIRCAGDSVEALVIVIEPRLPRARPHVKLGRPGHEASYETTLCCCRRTPCRTYPQWED